MSSYNADDDGTNDSDRPNDFGQTVGSSRLLSTSFGSGDRNRGSSRTPRTSGGSSRMSMESFMLAASMKSFQPQGTDEKTLAWSLWAVRIGLLADAMSTMILWPNYAFLASPGATDSSFESTHPFEFNGATYFLSLAPLFSTAIMSCLMGNISDRFGRRPSMLLCVGVSIFLTIGKYLVRDSFWGFSAASFVNGILAGTLPGACH